MKAILIAKPGGAVVSALRCHATGPRFDLGVGHMLRDSGAHGLESRIRGTVSLGPS